jgi:hypothetical protein
VPQAEGVSYRLPPLPLEARRELVLQGLEQQRTPESQATYLLIELLRQAAMRRDAVRRRQEKSADGVQAQ